MWFHRTKSRRNNLKKLKELTAGQKTLLRIFAVATLLLLIVIGGFLAYLRLQLSQISNQLSYMKDTLAVTQGEMGGLKSDIQAMLEEESSLIESYSIEVSSMDFAQGSYDVNISIVPKEYTDTMTISVYFGTREFYLEKDNFTYRGTAHLLLEEEYSGNVTVLFTDGTKKSTEILSRYKDLTNQLTNVLGVSMSASPTYKDGKFIVGSSVDVDLNGLETYSFTDCKYVIATSDEVLYQYDVLNDAKLEMPTEPEETEETETEETTVTVGSIEKTIEEPVSLDVEGGKRVRIYVEATTDTGMVFHYEIFSGMTQFQSDGFTTSNDMMTHILTVTDINGGSFEIDMKSKKEE